MKKLVAALALVTTLALPTAALAASPHFISASASGPNAAGALAVSFKIAGLGDTVTTTVTASAMADALYACQNGGGQFPSDPKKQAESGPVSASGAFTSGKNGHVDGSLVLGPLSSSLVCPPGQHRVLVSVAYHNVAVSSPDAGSMAIAGTFSRVFYVL